MGTEEATLGEVTAFLSHSWRDDPGEKHKALESWAQRYKEKYLKEATVWLDKACINQIEDVEKQKGIKCLPIFLAGCETLLITAGPTYCNRLWCVMECFTFLRMGGSEMRE